MWPWPLTFWPQNVISTSTTRNISVTKIWWNSLHWFFRYGVTGFRDIACCDLDLWPFDPKMQSAHLRPEVMEVYLWPKFGEIPFIGFWDMVFTKWDSQTHSLTHSLTHARTSVTDGQTRTQYAFGTVFQRWRRHNKKRPRQLPWIKPLRRLSRNGNKQTYLSTS